MTLGYRLPRKMWFPHYFMRALDVCLLLVAMVVLAAILRPRSTTVPLWTAETFDPLVPGETLQVPNSNWSTAPRHVVLVLNTTCPVCNTSLPFYRQLQDHPKYGSDFKVTVLTSEPAELMTAWLLEHGIQGWRVLTTPYPLRMGFVLTPTFLIVNSTGTISDLVEGQLDRAQELLAIARIGDPTTAPVVDSHAFAYISESGYRELRASSKTLLLDVSDRVTNERDMSPDSVRIPYAELETRARSEMSAAVTPVIDCRAISLMNCVGSINQLRDLGFPHVRARTGKTTYGDGERR